MAMSSLVNISFQRIIKRILDFSIALLLILILIIPFLILLIIVRLKMGSPTIFTQKRPGLNSKIFNIYKIRTMTDNPLGFELPDSARLTNLGKIIRKLSLDELPQLLNVLKGELSLVGPRPLLVEYLPLYSLSQAKRHNVPPGITGWAQINGRNSLSWKQKFEYDVWYVDNWSLWLDIKILFLTFFKVLKRDGVNQGENMTMEKFKGN